MDVGAIGGGSRVASTAARPDADGVCRERRAWTNRLVVITAAASPLAAVAFTWLFHDVVSTRVVVAWLALLAATSACSLTIALRQRGRLVDGTNAALVAIGLNALVFSLPPWLVGSLDDPGHGLALVFPIVALGIGVVVFAPARRWFLVHQSLVGLLTVLWALRFHGDFSRTALVGTIAGVVAITTLLHAEVHQLLNRALELNTRHAALLSVLQHEHVQIERTNTALGEANDRLRRQAAHDALTGALNRRGLEDRLDGFFGEARLASRHVFVLFCDLDRFKRVNDTFGHAAGDRLLVTTADRITAVLPDAALLARLGGDEFVAIVSLPHHDPDPAGTALELADRLRAAVAAPVTFEGREFVVTTTIGVATVPDGVAVTIDVLRNADRALHYAKDAGRDRAELFADVSAMARRPVDEAHLLRTAIEEGDIVPWYQPIVDAVTGHIIGAELLARWIDADGRAVRASEFIDTARDGGLVERLSEVLIDRALDDIARWETVGLPRSFRVGLNLPPRFASRTSRSDRLLGLLTRAPAHRVVAEVSETSVIDDLDVAAARLHELRALGIHLVLDDFGTGSASLSLLQRMPLDGVKIDRSFIAELPHVARDRALVSGFAGLAARLGLEVTAEGVERVEQARALVELGCTVQQGYLYGDAVDAVELMAQLRHGRPAARVVASGGPVRGPQLAVLPSQLS